MCSSAWYLGPSFHRGTIGTWESHISRCSTLRSKGTTAVPRSHLHLREGGVHFIHIYSGDPLLRWVAFAPSRPQSLRFAMLELTPFGSTSFRLRSFPLAPLLRSPSAALRARFASLRSHHSPILWVALQLAALAVHSRWQ